MNDYEHKIQSFIKKHSPSMGYWGEHKDFPVEDWKYEVANDDTKQGYWEWVMEQIDELEV